MPLLGGGCSFANGLSNHLYKSTLINRFNLIKANKLNINRVLLVLFKRLGRYWSLIINISFMKN